MIDDLIAVQHAPTVRRKQGTARTTRKGLNIPERTLYRYECRCGWKGAVFYSNQSLAQAAHQRHVHHARWQ